MCKKRTLWLIIVSCLLLINISCRKNEKELTFWIGGSPDEIQYWQKIIGQYEQVSNTKVNFVRQPTYTDQRRQSLVVSLVAQQANPDVFLMDVVWLRQFIKSDWLEPLDGHMQKTDFSVTPFYQRVINLTDRYQGVLYALPVFVDIGVLYYRTDLLQKHGFTGPPQSWNELYQYAKKIQDAEREHNPNFYGFVWQGAQYEGLVCTFMEFISSHGGGFSGEDIQNINSAENKRALQYMQDLIHKFKISPLNTYTEMKEEEVRRTFQRGNALFERNWLYAWNLHQSNGSNVKGKTGITSLPRYQDNDYASALGGWHIGISQYSDVKKQAWDLVQFILSYEIQKDMILKVGWYSARKDIYNDAEIQDRIPHVDKLQQIFNHAVNRPNISYYTQVSDVIQRFVNRCIANKTEPQEALEKMSSELRRINEIYSE